MGDPANEMVERVARELAFEHVRSEQFWCEWIPAARAAIEAMREPSDAMCDAAVPELLYDDQRACIGAAYRAMIDAALK